MFLKDYFIVFNYFSSTCSEDSGFSSSFLIDSSSSKFAISFKFSVFSLSDLPFLSSSFFSSSFLVLSSDFLKVSLPTCSSSFFSSIVLLSVLTISFFSSEFVLVASFIVSISSPRFAFLLLGSSSSLSSSCSLFLPTNNL